MLDGVRAAALRLHEELVGEGRDVELPTEPLDETATLLRRKVEQREGDG
jgi:hypothetical protein